jgi:hypothetical protein
LLIIHSIVCFSLTLNYFFNDEVNARLLFQNFLQETESVLALNFKGTVAPD